MNTEDAQIETVFQQGSHSNRWILVIPLGLIMFCYLGWVYQASWYWYFGIDVTQLKMPLPSILQQSMLILSISLSLIVILFGLIFLIRLIVFPLKNFFHGERRIELAKLFSIHDVFQGTIHSVVLAYVALILLFLKEVKIHNSSYPELELPANIVMLNLFIVPVAAILLLRLVGDWLGLLPAGVKQRLRLTSESRIYDEPYRMILGILVIFAASVMFTGTMAAGDASVGFRDNSSYQAVRRVYLKSYLPIAGLEPYRQDCDCNPYVYGPLGYLGNNEDYLFLIPWKAEGEERFPQFPALFQIERSSTNTINIIPEGGQPGQGNGVDG
jgi:hypothetical protein